MRVSPKMSDPSSAPPPQPSSTEPEPGIPRRHEHLLELEGSGKGWKRRRSVDFLKISPAGMELHHGGMLREPLVMPLGAIAVAAAESGPARALQDRGALRDRAPPHGDQGRAARGGIEGWLWTSTGGSAFLSLCDEDDDAPNAALVFAHPLGEESSTASSTPCVASLSARSPLGSPAVYGLIMRVSDVMHAQNTFHKFNIANPLTDKEIPPTLRRALPTDSRRTRPCASPRARAPRSIAPPGLASPAGSATVRGVSDAPLDPQACRPCRGTGHVISNLGGAPSTITCPWCEGSGRFTPGH